MSRLAVIRGVKRSHGPADVTSVDVARDDLNGDLRRYAAFSFFSLADLLCLVALFTDGYVRPGPWRVAFAGVTVLVTAAALAVFVVRRWSPRARAVLNFGAAGLVAVALLAVADRRGALAATGLFGLPAIFSGMYLTWRHVAVNSAITMLGATLLLWDVVSHRALLVPQLLTIAVATLTPAMALLLLRARLDATLARERVAALTDPLTGLANRRGLVAGATAVVERARADGLRVVVAVGDVDHFKRINDAHGHAVGDRALCRVAEVLRATAGPGAVVARTGGEEFAVLTAIDGDGMAEFGERLRAAVELSLAEFSTTISIGVVGLDPDRLDADHLDLHHGGGDHGGDHGEGDHGEGDVDPVVWSLVDRADTLAYCAKRRGRNQVVCAEEVVARDEGAVSRAEEVVARDEGAGDPRVPIPREEAGPTPDPAGRLRGGAVPGDAAG